MIWLSIRNVLFATLTVLATDGQTMLSWMCNKRRETRQVTCYHRCSNGKAEAENRSLLFEPPTSLAPIRGYLCTSTDLICLSHVAEDLLDLFTFAR